jgi:ABC-type uncharacterized transport system substrate-binding protein
MKTVMLNQENRTFHKRMYVITAAVAAIPIGIFLFLRFGPLKTAADDNNHMSEQVKIALAKQYKILHVMSYHSPWEWTDNQLKGFKAAMKDANVQYNIMQMDTKRRSDEAWKQKISREIRDTIDASKPDLIFASDDNAQLYVTKYYINTSIPIVFSAVNEDPAKYGFTGSQNVTGILEKPHYVATLRLLKKLVPNVKRVAMITDTGVMWPALIAEMQQQQDQFGDIQVVSYDIIPTFSEFKRKVRSYQNRVDALGFLGIFEFRDENGKNVPMEDVLKWLQKNSKLPDFSFWEDRVLKGTLCSVSVSAYEQGYLAGIYARDILLGRKKPAGLPMISTKRGTPFINMVTAKRLGIEPSGDILQLAAVIQDIALE